jgi:hypothetical protein
MGAFLTELAERYIAAKARVSAVKAEYDVQRSALESKFNKAFAQVKEEYLALETLLRLEEQKSGREATAGNYASRLPLAEFFLTALHAHGALSKDELRDQAERAGYFGDLDGGSGRTIHATLLNLCRTGRAKEIEQGVYMHAMAVLEATAAE